MLTSRILWVGVLLFTLTLGANVRAADTFKVDTVHSSILFKAQHMGAGFTVGRFDKFSGTITLDDAASAINLVVESASLNTGADKRDEHLRGADFFNAKESPQITFTSKSVKKSGDKTYEVTGEFTLLGVKKEVTFTAKQVGEGKGMKGEKVVGFEASLTVKRSDFGMKYMIDKLGDDIPLEINLEADAQ